MYLSCSYSLHGDGLMCVLCVKKCVVLCSKRSGGIESGERREGWEGSSRWPSEDRGTGEVVCVTSFRSAERDLVCPFSCI